MSIGVIEMGETAVSAALTIHKLTQVSHSQAVSFTAIHKLIIPSLPTLMSTRSKQNYHFLAQLAQVAQLEQLHIVTGI